VSKVLKVAIKLQKAGLHVLAKELQESVKTAEADPAASWQQPLEP